MLFLCYIILVVIVIYLDFINNIKGLRFIFAPWVVCLVEFLNRGQEIAGYLSLLQIHNIVKETIGKKVEMWRQRPSSSGSSTGNFKAMLVIFILELYL